MKRYCKILKVDGCYGLKSALGQVMQCTLLTSNEMSAVVDAYYLWTQHNPAHRDNPEAYLYPEGWEPGMDETVHLTKKPKERKRPYNIPVTDANWKDLVRQGLLKVGTKVMWRGEKCKVIELASMDYEFHRPILLKNRDWVSLYNEDMYLRPDKKKKGDKSAATEAANPEETIKGTEAATKTSVYPAMEETEAKAQVIKTHITHDNWDELVGSGRLCRGATVEVDDKEYPVLRVFDRYCIRVASPLGLYGDFNVYIADSPTFLLERSAPQQPSTEHKPPLLISANVLKQYIVSTVVHHCGEAVAVVPYTLNSVRGLRVTREGQPPIFVAEEDMIVSVPLEKGIPLK